MAIEEIFEDDASEEKGERAGMASFAGAIAITDLVKTTLGPKGMDRILQSTGKGHGDTVTNDGATILKSMHIDDPAAKVLIDISKAQDDEVGDGTTSVVVLAGELLREAEKLVASKIHPMTIIAGYRMAAECARNALLQKVVDNKEDAEKFKSDLSKIAMTTLSSKILSQDKEHFAQLAVDAVMRLKGSTNLEAIQIIKKPGGSLKDSFLDEGFILDKKIGVGQPKRIENAKILVANIAMDTDKVNIYGASVHVDSMPKVAENDVAEKEKMREKVQKIIAHGINCFVNRQLICNFPEEIFADAGILAVEHADFDGIERLGLVTGAEIASTFDNPESVKLGHCKLIEEIMIGEDKLIHFSGVKMSEACTIVLRGASHHVLDEAERSLHDALCVLSQTVNDTRVVLGGGWPEMLMAREVDELARKTPGEKSHAIEAFSRALVAIPTIIADNAGLDSADLVAQLRAEHHKEGCNAGIDVISGSIGDMAERGICESFKVKQAVLLSATEAAEMILRVDESSDPVPDEQPQNTNSNPAEPGPPVRKRRRRKRFFTELIANTSLSKNRRPRIVGMAKEMDTEALIAISVGFPVDSLTEEEIEANVVSRIGGQEQANYIVVRNHILSLWRSNVSDWLTLEQAFEAIRNEHKNLVDAAYNFLLEHGYINFGLAPPVKEAKLKSFDGVERANVVIVGAGLSGLVAARQLVSMGFKVVILEGRMRPGGRVKTRKMNGDGVVAAADLGGSVLTGINGNPLGVLARQMGLPLHKVRDICPLYLPDGKAVDADVDSRIEVSFNKLLDRVCKLRHSMIEEVKSVDVSLGTALEAFRSVYKVAEDSQESMLLNWHLANLEYANASLMANLSMAYWDQDDPYEMGGDHCFIPGGNERFVRALAEDLPIFYGRTVQSIRYGIDGVRVYAGGQEFSGDMALCTVPLGVLKKGSLEFVPELPQRKKDAIQRLGFGLLNKVAMLFPYNFWGGDIDTFGHLTEDPSMRGEFFLFYSYASVSGGPLLVALVAGDAAIKFELMSPVESVKRVLNILRGIFHPKGIVVPDPVQAVCTRWGKDRFAYGSYSHVAIGSSGDDYDILAESVGDGRVFFAGEATNKQYPATMHGAFLSGMREAANMLRVARRKSLLLTDKANNDIEKCDSLNKLFENPDLTFGSFSALFDPNSEDLVSHALIRVKFVGDKLESGCLCLYGLITKKQTIQLSELNGDGNRMNMLHRNFGVKLVGRKGLSNIGESLISRIKAAKLNLNVGDRV